MEATPCLKYKTPMDEGRMSWIGNNSAGYVFNKQTGMLKLWIGGNVSRSQ